MNIEWLIGGLVAAIAALVVVKMREKNVKKRNVLAIPGANNVIWAIYDLGMSDAQSVLRWIKENKKSTMDRKTIEQVLSEGSGDLFTALGGRYDLMPRLRSQMDSRPEREKTGE